MSNNDKVIKALKRENGNEIRVSIGEFKNNKNINIREWYDRDGVMCPTKKGVVIRIDEADEFAEAVSQAAKQL